MAGLLVSLKLFHHFDNYLHRLPDKVIKYQLKQVVCHREQTPSGWFQIHQADAHCGGQEEYSGAHKMHERVRLQSAQSILVYTGPQRVPAQGPVSWRVRTSGGWHALQQLLAHGTTISS